MSKWTWIAIAAVLVMLLGKMARYTGKGTGAGDLARTALTETYDECTERYAVPAPTELTTRAAVTYCHYRTNPAARPIDKALADCMLPKLPSVQSDIGFRVAVGNCARATSG